MPVVVLIVRLNDFNGLFQTKQFYDSLSPALCWFHLEPVDSIFLKCLISEGFHFTVRLWFFSIHPLIWSGVSFKWSVADDLWSNLASILVAGFSNLPFDPIPNWWLSWSVCTSIHEMEMEMMEMEVEMMEMERVLQSKEAWKDTKEKREKLLEEWMPIRRDLQKHKSRYAGRLLKELRNKDQKCQPMAEAKRTCVWGADSSETKLRWRFPFKWQYA